MTADAMALADALERALKDIPEGDDIAAEEAHARLAAIIRTALEAEAVASREKLDADAGQVVYLDGIPCVRVIREVAEIICTPLVFTRQNGQPWGDVDTAFRSVLKKAGIGNFRFHDLRHTAASHLTMRGRSLKEVQEFMGHRDSRMTMRSRT